jgi:hypothetical protein
MDVIVRDTLLRKGTANLLLQWNWGFWEKGLI